MKKNMSKKEEYQKETVFFMWIWLILIAAGLLINFVDAAFGEPLNVMSTIISIMYLIFFGLGIYFAKQGKLMAGVLELVVGIIILLVDFIPDKGIGLNGILGIIIFLHSLMYLFQHRKNNK